MNKEKHENSKHSKTHHVQQAGLEETKVLAEQGAFIPQRQPQMQQISRMANIPNPGAHAAILNRTKANQLSSNRQLLLQLQRQYGNSYVQRVMQQMQHSRELVPSASRQQPDVQAKLTIGEPGSEYEREADKVARQVVQQINAPASVESAQSQTVQRQAPDEDELMMKSVVQLQADTEMTAAPDLEASINQARGSGQPLADNIREPMEQAFGADFSGVKVHTDARADQLNQSIQAKAFTTGQDVFFRSGEYNPGSLGGQELLAHELTHVVQQNGTAVLLSPLSSQMLLQRPVINHDIGLEEKANVMDSKAQTYVANKNQISRFSLSISPQLQSNIVVQRVLKIDGQDVKTIYKESSPSQDAQNEDVLNIASYLYEEIQKELSKPVPYKSPNFFRALRAMDEWKNRREELQSILVEWINAPGNDANNKERVRGSSHAMTRDYPNYQELAQAVLGHADASLRIIGEEAQATEVLESEVLKNELVGFVREKLSNYLAETKTEKLDGNLLTLIEQNKGKYLPHMGDGLSTIKDIMNNPNKYSIGLLIAAIHDITDILWSKETTKSIVTIPDNCKQGLNAEVNQGQLEYTRKQFEDKDWRGKGATPKETSFPIETSRVLKIPVCMGPSNTTGRMMMLAQASGASVKTKESIAWGLFAFWYNEYRRELTDIHRQHFVLDMAANFGVNYNPEQPVIPERFNVLTQAQQHSLQGGNYHNFPHELKPMLEHASVQKLKNGLELSEIEKEATLNVEERTRHKIVILIMQQGGSQEQLTEALSHWYNYVDI
ncbi:hypothetical protein NIES4071_05420 [Calothrix sp. NIES-4071]|nr:hypothetical protein NIES4071_05420 [Calothrix sp. NIES-4071]BAZ54887.1 hypothetical protein NIES4105_05410 [Calothrix sp. NIES-4105]